MEVETVITYKNETNNITIGDERESFNNVISSVNVDYNGNDQKEDHLNPLSSCDNKKLSVQVQFLTWYNESLCRLCAANYKDKENLISITKDKGLKHDLQSKLKRYLQIEVTVNDQLPKLCCRQCAMILLCWHNMVINSKKAEIRLKKMLKKLPETEKENQFCCSEKEIPIQVNNQNTDNDDNEQMPDHITDGSGNTAIITVNDSTANDNAHNDDVCGDISYSMGEYMHETRTGGEIKNVENLQPYKLHIPVKWVTGKNGEYYLRTKVLGFEPKNIQLCSDEKYFLPFYTCCLCNEYMSADAVIEHSRSHYPLLNTNSCKVCNFGFSHVELLRHHLKKHVVFVDEEINQAESRKRDKLNAECNNRQGIPTDSLNKDACNKETMTSEVVQDEISGISKFYSNNLCNEMVCEYCGKVCGSGKVFLQHIKSHKKSSHFCVHCRKHFKTRNVFNNHHCIKIITNNKTESGKLHWHRCKCKKTFLYENQFLKHKEICENPNNMGCNIRSKTFQSKLRLDLHKVQTRTKVLTGNSNSKGICFCEICGCQLSAFSIKKHYLTHCFTEKKYSCPTCEMKFVTKHSLEKHIILHSNLRPFNCKMCDATFKRKDHVKLHLKRKHNYNENNDSAKFECCKCKRLFTSEVFLIRHQRLHSSKVSYECGICKTRFPTEHSLKMHQTKAKHDSDYNESSLNGNINISTLSSVDWINRYRCKICSKRYGSKHSLRKHCLLHLTNSKSDTDGNNKDSSDSIEESNCKNKKVENCNKTKKRQIEGIIIESKKNQVAISSANSKTESLKKSEDSAIKESVNEDENVFKCPKCNLCCLSEHGLKLHFARSKHGPFETKSKHKDYMNKSTVSLQNCKFKCIECKEMFSNLLSLKMHRIKRRHFSKCSECGKNFAVEFKLHKHMIKKHNKKESELCLNIDEFKQQEYMPYQCKYCLQKFVMNHNLLKHMHKKHYSLMTNDDGANIEHVSENLSLSSLPVIFINQDAFDNNFTLKNETDIQQQQPVTVYQCTDCWNNFLTEEDFQNHTHTHNVIASTSEENIGIKPVHMMQVKTESCHTITA